MESTLLQYHQRRDFPRARQSHLKTERLHETERLHAQRRLLSNLDSRALACKLRLVMRILSRGDASSTNFEASPNSSLYSWRCFVSTVSRATIYQFEPSKSFRVYRPIVSAHASSEVHSKRLLIIRLSMNRSILFEQMAYSLTDHIKSRCVDLICFDN